MSGEGKSEVKSATPRTLAERVAYLEQSEETLRILVAALLCRLGGKVAISEVAYNAAVRESFQFTVDPKEKMLLLRLKKTGVPDADGQQVGAEKPEHDLPAEPEAGPRVLPLKPKEDSPAATGGTPAR
jgi:hypothetical protein